MCQLPIFIVITDVIIIISICRSIVHRQHRHIILYCRKCHCHRCSATIHQTNWSFVVTSTTRFVQNEIVFDLEINFHFFFVQIFFQFLTSESMAGQRKSLTPNWMGIIRHSLGHKKNTVHIPKVHFFFFFF